MYQAIYTGAMGVNAQQTRLDVIADNMANVNTPGFKSSVMRFQDALYAAVQDPSDANSDKNLQIGMGVLPSSVMRNFTQGQTNVTGEPLDFLIDGNGFFAIQDTDGTVAYTRVGTFNISVEQDGEYLVNGAGLYVLDEAGQRIKMQGAISTQSVNAGGQISDGANEPYARIGVYDFPNKNGLLAKGGGLFTESVNSGAVQAVETPNVLQGAIESSNVDTALEMTLMIRSQRALSLASRCITTADTMEGQTNNIRA